MFNVKQWHPIPELATVLNSYSFWCSWAKLFNMIVELQPQQHELHLEESKEHDKLVVLPESVSVAGFKPMNNEPNLLDKPVYVKDLGVRTHVEDIMRFMALLELATLLESLKVIQKVKFSGADSNANGTNSLHYEAVLPELKTPVKYNWADEAEAAENSSRHSRMNTVRFHILKPIFKWKYS